MCRACALLSITGASSSEGARTRSCAGLHAATSTTPRAPARHCPAEGTASKRRQNGSKGSVDTAPGSVDTAPGSVDTAPGTAGTCPTATKAKAKRTKPAGASDSCRGDSFTSPWHILYISAHQTRTRINKNKLSNPVNILVIDDDSLNDHFYSRKNPLNHSTKWGSAARHSNMTDDMMRTCRHPIQPHGELWTSELMLHALQPISCRAVVALHNLNKSERHRSYGRVNFTQTLFLASRAEQAATLA